MYNDKHTISHRQAHGRTSARMFCAAWNDERRRPDASGDGVLRSAPVEPPSTGGTMVSTQSSAGPKGPRTAPARVSPSSRPGTVSISANGWSGVAGQRGPDASSVAASTSGAGTSGVDRPPQARAHSASATTKIRTTRNSFDIQSERDGAAEGVAGSAGGECATNRVVRAPIKRILNTCLNRRTFFGSPCR